MQLFSIHEKAKPYTDALRRLIRSGTATASLEDSPLIDLPVVLVKAGEDAPLSIRAGLFIEILTKVVNERLQGNDQRAAEMLFGLGEWCGKGMQDRHYAVAKLRNPHGDWEHNYRKEPLDRDLLMVFTALYREGEQQAFDAARPSSAEPQSSQLSDEQDYRRPARRLVEGGDYKLSYYESCYNLPKQPGEPRRVFQTREIMALADGVDAWRSSTRFWGVSTGSLPDITLFGSGTLSTTLDHRFTHRAREARTYISEVRFPKPLNQGEQARFTLLKIHPADFGEVVVKDEEEQHGFVDIVVPIDHAKVSIRFPEEFRPIAVWHFEELPDWLSPGTPTEQSTLMIDSSGFVSFEWRNLLRGYSYGIAWRWGSKINRLITAS